MVRSNTEYKSPENPGHPGSDIQNHVSTESPHNKGRPSGRPYSIHFIQRIAVLLPKSGAHQYKDHSEIAVPPSERISSP